MLELLRGRSLEGDHLAALRVHAGHHVLDRAVLAAAVHALEDHEHRVATGGVEQSLLRAELAPVAFEELERAALRLLLAEHAELLRLRPARIVILQPDLASRFHAQVMGDVACEHPVPPRRTNRDRHGVRARGHVGWTAGTLVG